MIGAAELRSLIDEAFPAYGPGAVEIGAVDDVNRGRGVFSDVVRVALDGAGDGERPSSVVIKRPAAGADGRAAIASGACERESLAYRRVVDRSPIRAPRCHLVRTEADGGASFVLEDLTPFDQPDQLIGLGTDRARAVVTDLGRLHRHWAEADDLDRLAVRRATPTVLDPAALRAGLTVLEDRWTDAVDDEQRAVFARLVAARGRLVDAFAAAGPATLCHGDPRADNLAFDGATPVFYDWQQLAVQFGAADVAWLATTSLTVADRRSIERDLLDDGGITIDHYRLALVLPGLAVLLLAQRSAPDARTSAFIATSLDRIATALIDLDVGR